ncbi:MAG: LON peptidase substrate-binding domain-containing protein, partial [Thermosynechococcaceae cyanobacterium]
RYERLPDDRMMVLCLGQQRFRVLDYVRDKPYRVGLVEWISDESTQADLQPLAGEVKQLFKDVVVLSDKLTEQETELPDDIPEQPTQLSYWVASKFHGAAPEQQALLETQDTQLRLEREIEILTSTRNHLAARTVLKDTLSS